MNKITSQVKGTNLFIVSIGNRQKTRSAQCHFGIALLLSFILCLSIYLVRSRKTSDTTITALTFGATGRSLAPQRNDFSSCENVNNPGTTIIGPVDNPEVSRERQAVSVFVHARNIGGVKKTFASQDKNKTL